MARLKVETVPEVTVFDEAAVFKAASGATAPLVEFKNSSGTVVANIAANGTINVSSITASNPGNTSSDYATRGYVDSVTAGLNWHEAANYATTTTLPSCTYSNGTGGVGATLIGTATGRLSVDSTEVSNTQSILVKNQANAVQNGVYIVSEQGNASVAFTLTRRSDANNNIPGQLKTGDSLLVLSGTTNATRGYVLTSTGSGSGGAFVLGTDNLTYTQFTAASSLNAGDGMVLSGNDLNVATASSTRIVVNADSIDLATVALSNTSGADTTTFVSSVTRDSYGRVTAVETSNVAFTGYATLSSPTFTGIPAAPTAAADTNTTQIATTAYVVGQAYLKSSTASSTYAPLASPALTGTPTAPNAAIGTNTTQVATTAFAVAEINDKAIIKTFVNAKGDLVTATADNTPAILTVGSNGTFLKANSSATAGLQWASIPLDDLSDVTITSAAAGHVLQYNGSAWVNVVQPANIDIVQVRAFL